MPDLTLMTTPCCPTNEDWTTEVFHLTDTSKVYTIRWCRQYSGRVQCDYECNCPAFSYGTKRPCKHIELVKKNGRRCAWNSDLDYIDAETLKKDDEGNRLCPNCKQPVIYVKIAV